MSHLSLLSPKLNWTVAITKTYKSVIWRLFSLLLCNEINDSLRLRARFFHSIKDTRRTNTTLITKTEAAWIPCDMPLNPTRCLSICFCNRMQLGKSDKLWDEYKLSNKHLSKKYVPTRFSNFLFKRYLFYVFECLSTCIYVYHVCA